MKIYLVGGAVRDKLLGHPVNEKDWVVVGASVNDMLKLGYKQVGKEFPVFLHPKTNDEYALARMERKTAPGYTGFAFDTSPDVTLADDLIRRDLTINAMAMDEATGELIDPYHGKRDLDAKVLRHVSEAFAEDPVRILRVGRFLARYAHKGFTVAPETYELMRKMVAAGEVDALVAERVWKELERALGEQNPEKFFEVLETCGALPILFPGIDERGTRALVAASKLSNNPAVRLAAYLHAETAANIAIICDRYRAPNAYKELAKLTAEYHNRVIQALSAEEVVSLFAALDIYRREERFHDFLLACEAIHTEFNSQKLREYAHAAKTVDVQKLIAEGFEGGALAEKLKLARREVIATLLRN